MAVIVHILLGRAAEISPISGVEFRWLRRIVSQISGIKWNEKRGPTVDSSQTWYLVGGNDTRWEMGLTPLEIAILA
ncbi:MAG: hypothetical protein IIB32_06310 [Chloroflexi bacterium]|nr:hypothetical protein [Chloroflexota bacterium]